jgi:2'-5' RNA ligase
MEESVRPNWFIGLKVPAGAWYDERFDVPSPAFRRFHPDDLHMTVAFLGAVEEDTARAAFLVNERWDQGGLDVNLGPVVAMGNPRRYSALSLLLTAGDDGACALMEQLKAPMLVVAGQRPDERPHKPHITVARPKRRAEQRERQLGLTWADGFDLSDTSLRLDKIALYTWSLDRKEQLFRIMDERQL